MNDIYYHQKYKCSTCKETVRIGIWLSNIDKKQIHEVCGKKLKPIFEEKEEGFSIGGKHRNGRGKTEKRKRSTDHFNK